MSRVTDDPNDPDVKRGPADETPTPQSDAYLVLSDLDRAKGFIRPVRLSYKHTGCGTVTKMSQPIAETYARDPKFYGATYCVSCKMHRPVSEFTWDGTDVIVGT
jgi:hypothetical protein